MPDKREFTTSGAPRGEAERALFAAFLESAPAAVAMFDREMRYLYASRRWLTDFHLDGATITGRSHYDVFPEIGDEWKQVHQRCLAGATEQSDVDRFERLDGRIQYFRWQARPWHRADGEVGGLIILTEEVTDQQRRAMEAAEDQARVRAALAMADAAVWEYHPKTRKFYASDKLAELAGQETVSADWVLRFSATLHPDDVQAFSDAARQFWRGGDGFAQDLRVRRRDEGYRWVRSYVARIGEDGGRDSPVIGFLKDIGSLKEAELAAREAQEKATAASAAKSQFLATISHEIRTPMNGVLGMATALETTPLSDEQRRMLSVIQSSGEDLLSLLNDLIDLSRAEAGKIALYETDFYLPELLERVAALFSETAEARGNRLHLDIAPSAFVTLEGDAVRIRQVINNLVSNAIKFTDAGLITISARRERDANSEVQTVIAVNDTGIGIAPEHFERVFEPFVQVDPTLSRQFSGSGLGLTICKRLIDQMRGTISISSELGRGATFRVVLPLRESDSSIPVAAEPSASVPSEKHDLRILVAEDNHKNRLVLQSVLSAAGAEVIFASDGIEAVERWEDGGIDVVLMDVRMPVADGIWATERIREMEDLFGCPRTPIIALTADATEEGIACALEAGMDGHIAKPIRVKPLLNAISGVARR